MISDLVQHRPTKFYLSCIVLALTTGALWAYQGGSDVLYCNDPAQITDAVMITNVTVEGKTVNCGLFIKPPAVVQPVMPFPAGPDWLQTMAISMINRTNKIIVAGQITLNFLDTGDCRSAPCATAHIHLGEIPAIDAYNARTGKPLKNRGSYPLDWEPDQVLTVHIGDDINDILTESGLLHYMPVTAVSKVAVHIGAFYFRDGMKWGGGGAYAIPDPQHPGKFNHLPDNYFPGKRNHNWPPGYDQ